jgi:hypothetical protein
MKLAYCVYHHSGVLVVSKKSGGADEFGTRRRLLSYLKLVDERVLRRWTSFALHGAMRTSASQLKHRVNCERVKSKPCPPELCIEEIMMKRIVKGWRCEAANPHTYAKP